MARRWITGEAGGGHWEEDKKKKTAAKPAPKIIARPEPEVITTTQGPSLVGTDDPNLNLQNGANMGAGQPGGGGNMSVHTPNLVNMGGGGQSQHMDTDHSRIPLPDNIGAGIGAGVGAGVGAGGD